MGAGNAQLQRGLLLVAAMPGDGLQHRVIREVAQAGCGRGRGILRGEDLPKRVGGWRCHGRHHRRHMVFLAPGEVLHPEPAAVAEDQRFLDLLP